MIGTEIWDARDDLTLSDFAQIGDVLRATGFGTECDGEGTQGDLSHPFRNALQALFERSARIDATGADGALDTDTRDLLLQSGFVARDGDTFVPMVRIERWHDLFIAGDLKGADRTRDDAVFAVSGTTRILDNLRVNRPVGHAVDLGSGSGALALRLAKHAKRVSAVDINPRAIAYTRVNAAMNRIGTVTAYQGSLYEPLNGELAELILGNLPFVLSPDQRHLYRDGDRPGGKILTDAVQGAVDHLAPGGVAQFTCNWPIRGADATAWLRDLASQTKYDALAIEYKRRTPLDHARNWNRIADAPNPAEQLALERRWADWFAAQGIDHIAFGALNLRRPIMARNGRFDAVVAEKLPEDSGGGQQIERMIRAMDAPLAPDSVPIAVPHMVYQQLVHDGASYTSMPAEFFCLDSAGIGLTVLPEVTPALLAVDGKTPITEIADPDDPGHAVLLEAYRRGLIDLAVA